MAVQTTEMAETFYGEDWTDIQNDLVVADYFAMLAATARGDRLVKLHRYKHVAVMIGKSHKAVERKHQNISAVLEKIGLHWLNGLAPLRNYQASLIAAVDRYLSERPELTGNAEPEPAIARVFERQLVWQGPRQSLALVPPPVLTADDGKSTDALARLVQKFDPVLRDARNRQLGLAGFTSSERSYARAVVRIWPKKSNGPHKSAATGRDTTSPRSVRTEMKNSLR